MSIGKVSLRLVGAVLCLCLFTTTTNAATIITGSIFEFGGPDDLDLSNVVIAAGVYQEVDRTVNGVIFRAASQTVLTGTATEGGVTATISSNKQINNWRTAQIYTGGTAGSAAELGEIMRDIRWSNNRIIVEVEGLVPGDDYKLQLLTNNGGTGGRHWDIGVGDDAAGALANLVVDDITSEGDDTIPGVWTRNNGFGYEGTFTASATGTLVAVMQDDFGGGRSDGDHNPILQAVIVNAAIPEPSSFVLVAFGLLTLAGARFRRRRRGN